MMERLIRFFSVVLLLIGLVSCERSGYYDTDQQSRLTLLTSVKWRLNGSVMDNDGSLISYSELWSFDRKGKASCVYQNVKDGEVIRHDIAYYDWTFTTENFAVIYLYSVTSGASFWQIEKLTDTDLWVKTAMQDPVIYPGVNINRVRFESVEK